MVYPDSSPKRKGCKMKNNFNTLFSFFSLTKVIVINYLSGIFDRLSLEEFALQDEKPNAFLWGHMSLRDVTLFDFGLPVEDNDNLDAVQAKIQEINDIFDLVMVK